MRHWITIYVAVGVAGFSLLNGCAPTYESYYPSYERVMAKYAPPGKQVAKRVADPSGYPVAKDCDCPRVWYGDHWVYYYEGSWIFWRHGYWHYYPYFDWYYFGYGPVYYRGPERVIVSTSKSKAAISQQRTADMNAARMNPPRAKNRSTVHRHDSNHRTVHRTTRSRPATTKRAAPARPASRRSSPSRPTQNQRSKPNTSRRSK